MEMRDVKDVVGQHSGLSRKVLEYSLIMKDVVDAAKRPGFSAANWAPLAQMVDVAAFERVGNFKEVMRWPDYVEFLTRWAPNAEWECSFKRITEKGPLVFLELEERSEHQGQKSVVNSMSVYEFDATEKLRHLDIYLQMELPKAALPEFY